MWIFLYCNLGNESQIEAGGTQRFTSGSGAWHSEMPASHGRNRGLQLWINLPRRLKKMPPDYEGIAAKYMPTTQDGGVRTSEVVGPNSPVVMQTAMGYRTCSFPNKGACALVGPSGHQGLVYVLEGEIKMLGAVFKEGDVVIPSAGRLPLEAQAGTRVAHVHGRPRAQGRPARDVRRGAPRGGGPRGGQRRQGGGGGLGPRAAQEEGQGARQVNGAGRTRGGAQEGARAPRRVNRARHK